MEVDEAASGRVDYISIEEPHGFHSCRIPSDTICLCIKEEGHNGHRHEEVIGGVSQDDTKVVIKLEVSEAELGVFTGAEAEV